ncbi:MAG: PD-(D/E)XK nuclease family transposase [Spirochaetota bacterium]
MLTPLDNEAIFKIAFTDIEVLTGFVKDIVGIDIEVEKIETEKGFFPRVGNIDFKYDIFAESTDHRVIVELQRVEYDYHFDRFLHYHYMAVSELQRKAEAYQIEQEVYTIALLTRPYRALDKEGKIIKDEVLISQADPVNLKNDIVPIYGHKLIFLNPHHRSEETPSNYKDWLDLFYESIHNRENYQLNPVNAAVQKAASLINYDQLSPEQIREMKDKESKRLNYARMEEDLKQKEEDLKQKEEDLKQKEEDLKQRDEDLKQKDEDLKQKDGDLKQKDEQVNFEQNRREQAEKDKQQAQNELLQQQQTFIAKLIHKGMVDSEIIELTGLSQAQIQKIRTELS